MGRAHIHKHTVHTFIHALRTLTRTLDCFPSTSLLTAAPKPLLQRRYVIDYYYDDGAEDEEGMPALHAEGAVKSIKASTSYLTVGAKT